MHTIEQLPTTQQAALRDAMDNGILTLTGSSGYVAGDSNSRHPIRTIRALIRADLMEEVGKRVQLTEQGRAVAEGRA